MTWKINLFQAREIRAAWTEFLPTVDLNHLPKKEFKREFGKVAKEFRIKQGVKYGISQRTVEEVLLGRSHKEPNP